jgi:hypothetical protein
VYVLKAAGSASELVEVLLPSADKQPISFIDLYLLIKHLFYLQAFKLLIFFFMQWLSSCCQMFHFGL